jgi:3-oxoacyl-[acyl-carrier-protein] synthase II
MTTLLKRVGVVITGAGVVTPIGCSLDILWASLLAARSPARSISIAADASSAGGDRQAITCAMNGFDGRRHLDAKEARRLDPFARYGLVAALDAFDDAGRPDVDPMRCAVVVGNAVGGRTTSDEQSMRFALQGPSRVHPLMPVMTMANSAAALISMRLGWTGPALTIATTCASGVDAIGTATDLIRSGRVDVAVAGGCESTLTPVTLAGFANLGAMSQRFGEPATASRPFDPDRDGFVMSEGAGFVLLESEDHAGRRGAVAMASVEGYAATADGHHLSMPLPDGSGARACMLAALADAGIDPVDVSHVNAHGTSTPLNDRAEACAIRTVFGPRAVPVTSNKGVLGHMIGAAGAVETIATVLALGHGLVPPTANHMRTENGMEIDVVVGEPREIPAGPALTNSFGFGGHNACLIVGPR